jgi:hypothetical protein
MQINELIDTKPIEFFEKPLIFDKLARKIILNHFNRIKEGEITVIENSTHITFGETTANFPVKATIEVQNPRMYLDIVAKGFIVVDRYQEEIRHSMLDTGTTKTHLFESTNLEFDDAITRPVKIVMLI